MNIKKTSDQKEKADLKSRRLKKNDFLLIILLLLISSVSGAWYFFTHQTPAIRAEVTVDGKLVETLDLSKNQEVTIHGLHGGTNHLIVQNGEIWCSEASCPDSVCIHQGKQSRDGDLIVCLPNLMIVQIIGEE